MNKKHEVYTLTTPFGITIFNEKGVCIQKTNISTYEIGEHYILDEVFKWSENSVSWVL